MLVFTTSEGISEGAAAAAAAAMAATTAALPNWGGACGGGRPSGEGGAEASDAVALSSARSCSSRSSVLTPRHERRLLRNRGWELLRELLSGGDDGTWADRG